MKVAAVDIGTNTVRLLLAGSEPVGDGVRLVNTKRHEVITRLGEGLESTGRLGEEPMRRALAGLRQYADLIASAGVDVAGGVATAATRSAANGPEFAERVAETLGFAPRVIDGVEEARLTFVGATSSRVAQGPYCVIDVGGGSTEFVIGGDLPEYAISIDIGSVRLTERRQAIGLDDPAALREHVDMLLSDVVAPLSPNMVLGSGGTYVTLAAVAARVSTADIEARVDTTLTVSSLVETVDQLLAMDVAEIAALPAVVPARAPVLQAGAVCAEGAVAHIGASQVHVSVSDILDGVAMELGANKWPGAVAPGH